MGESFRKVKKKLFIGALVKAAVCGISFGLISAGAVLLGLKLSAISIHPLFYVLIGLVAAVGCFALVFLLLKPSDKKLAKRLDSKYGLREKSQTALEFGEKSGAVIELQRSDADSAIAAIPRTKFSFAKIWQYVVVAAVALAVSATAIIIPAKADEKGGPNIWDDPFELTEYQEISVRNLIAYINGSHLETSIKSYSAETLGGLIEDLRQTKTMGGMRTLVTDALSGIQGRITALSSYRTIGEALLEDGRLSNLVEAISDGATAYRSVSLMTEEEADALYSAGIDLIITAAISPLTDFRKELDVKLADGLANLLMGLSGSIQLALSVADISESDILYGTCMDLADGFLQIKAVADGGAGDEAVQAEIDKFLGVKNASVGDWQTGWGLKFVSELTAQSYRLGMNRFINNRLRTIFGLPLETESNEGIGDGGNNSPGDDDRQPNQGGYGTGENVYGDDVKVYDPFTGEYVPYGELMDRYYAIVQEILRSGDITDEEERMILEYFEILTNGFKTEE